jgi:hypothetical protein
MKVDSNKQVIHANGFIPNFVQSREDKTRDKIQHQLL